MAIYLKSQTLFFTGNVETVYGRNAKHIHYCGKFKTLYTEFSEFGRVV